MQIVQHSAAIRRAVTDPKQFPPLELVNCPAATTEQAATDLNWVGQPPVQSASLDLRTRAPQPATEDEALKRQQQPLRAKTIYPVPLDRETRVALPTPEAAFHLNRAQQTLRGWACNEDGPLRPIRVNGRLAWSVAGIKALLRVD